jgi:arginase
LLLSNFSIKERKNIYTTMAAAPKSVSITYVPADCGSVIPGKSKAPEAFQNVNIAQKLRDAGVSVASETQALRSPARWEAAAISSNGVRSESVNVSVCQQVHRCLVKSLGDSPSVPPFQLILGGECGMSPAVMSAFWQHAASQSPPRRVGLIYIDADTDLASSNTPGASGTFASMNMTHLVQAPGSLQSMKEFSRPSGEPVCDASNTVLFGTNMAFSGNKNEHFAYLFDNNYKVVSSASVAGDPEQRALDALKHLEDSVDVIMVHLDVDAIDPGMFPLANVPNYTGVAFEEMMGALKIFVTSDKVGGLTIAEVNPDHDPGLKMTERLTREVVNMIAARRSI